MTEVEGGGWDLPDSERGKRGRFFSGAGSSEKGGEGEVTGGMEIVVAREEREGEEKSWWCGEMKRRGRRTGGGCNDGCLGAVTVWWCCCRPRWFLAGINGGRGKREERWRLERKKRRRRVTGWW
ncbi:hypothetical protein HAX54_024577 [Datura stramonium]|uniref:Uncharacterized protein n=1 Tax=Datura stramonium TaxID=4076 RepID=A0ABS8V0C0_DATST|nr:hypothetical protein [Datura stramonium]